MTTITVAVIREPLWRRAVTSIKGMWARALAKRAAQCKHRHPDGSSALYEDTEEYADKCELCDFDRSVIW